MASIIKKKIRLATISQVELFLCDLARGVSDIEIKECIFIVMNGIIVLGNLIRCKRSKYLLIYYNMI